MIVIDSNIFIKLFKEETDYEIAKEFLNYALIHEIPLCAPDLFKYEVMAIAQKFRVDISEVEKLIQSYEKVILSIESLSAKTWKSAISMIQDGHIKSGFPSIYDSVYHCLALEKDFIFLTADDRHLKKTTKYGGVVLLNEWRTLFEGKK